MKKENGAIVILGCFDTKGEDFSYLHKCITSKGKEVITINVGVMDPNVDFRIDFGNEHVSELAGTTLDQIRKEGDRGKAVGFMGRGAGAVIAELVLQGTVSGVIGMGGGGGTYMALSAMQQVPLGIPKLCLSTLATMDLSRQVGVKDITLMSSVVDVAGLNSISTLLIEQAASGICAMSEVERKADRESQKSIAMSMFGNTTKCVDRCTKRLKEKGYEVMAFHATGVGGAAMESLIKEGCFDAVLDITTTELADELCGGILSAGPDRLTAASEMGIPQIVVPGCMDMVNFAHVDTIPEKYKSRQLYNWAPDVTLMRTDKAENVALGALLAKKINASKSPVVVLLPKQGISQIDSAGGIFYNPEYDQALFDSIKKNVNKNIPVIELEANINDGHFADALVEHLLKIINKN